MRKPLLTHEIGSLAKPNWRVKALRNLPLNDQDLEEARNWARKLDLEADAQELFALLEKRQGFSREEKRQLVGWASRFAVRLLEKAGLDVIYDGEQHRVEMYEYPIRRIRGFAFRGHVRSFDNKYYRKAAVVEKPAVEKPYHLEEYQTIAQYTTRPVKIPITGAYTLVDWSFDEYYLQHTPLGTAEGLRLRKEARRRFLQDMAREVLYPNLKALVEAGAQFLQIDEPAATTHPEEVPDFVAATIESVGDLQGRVTFGMHICFSDYRLLFPHLRELEGVIHEMHFEYANRDSRELGVNDQVRVGYRDTLRLLKDTRFIVGLGVLDVHTDFIEPVELIRDRILYALEVIQDPERLYIAPDCGLRTRTWEVAFAKLRNMVEAVEQVRAQVGL